MRINIWWNLIPVFSFFLGWIFLSETLSRQEIIAFIVLLAGGCLASVHLGSQGIRFSKAFGWMLLSCLGFAIYAVIFRHVTQELPVLTVFFWSLVVSVIASVTFFLSPSFRGSFRADLAKLDGSLGVTVVALAIFGNLGTLFNIWALSSGPVALVFALEGTQLLFVFLLTFLISRVNPHLLHETFDRKNVLLKCCAMVMILVGIYLLHLR